MEETKETKLNYGDMGNTLYEVATLKAKYDLLKSIVMDSIGLDYYGNGYTVDGKYIIMAMKSLDPDGMKDKLQALQDEKKTKMEELTNG